eukprot:2767333-Rhodomonas_salina.1
MHHLSTSPQASTAAPHFSTTLLRTRRTVLSTGPVSPYIASESVSASLSAHRPIAEFKLTSRFHPSKHVHFSFVVRLVGAYATSVPITA